MNPAAEYVILVDEKDRACGQMEKLQAHRQGLLHRAFSVLLFNEEGALLLQKRAAGKYHCPGLWTNTCCSHPRPGETVLQAAHRRLREEMGISCALEKSFDFIYKVRLNNGLSEHEFDHVLVGRFSGLPVINPAEVADWKYMGVEALKKEMALHPADYTPWFTILFSKMY